MTHRLSRIACCLALLLIADLAAAAAFAAPVITSISRASGPPAGRTPITITGTDFANGATVTFGGVAAHDVVVASSTSITCAAPAHPVGAVSLVVTNPDEQSGSASYSYVLPSADGTYGGTVIGDGPVAFYRFDDTGATSVAGDISGNDFHASLAGGVTPGASGAVGNGSAYIFDGSSGYLELPGSWGGASWQQLTIEAWVNVAASTSDYEAVVSSIDAGFAHMQLSSGGNMVVYSDSGAVHLPPAPQSPGSAWRHLVIVAESGNSRLYVDGVLAGTDSTPFSSITASSGVRIGSGYQNGRFFNGRIDEVAIYDKALTDAQVVSHYGARAVPDVHWINSAGGNWSVASNWSTGAVPTSTDNVYIDASGTYTVNVDVGATARTIGIAAGATLLLPSQTLTISSGGVVSSGATLRVAGGQLTDGGPMTVDGTLDWTAGSITGAGTLTISNGGNFSLSNTAYKDLVSRRIDLSGTMTWQGYPLRASGGAELHVLPGGLFDIQTDYDLEWCCSGGNAPALHLYAATATKAAGTLRKSGGTADTYLNGPLYNDGVVTATSGTLVVNGGGSGSGLFDASPSSGSSAIQFHGQPYTLSGTITSTGLGSIVLTGGTLSISGTINSTARFVLAGGTLSGTGTFTSNGTFAWTGGAMAGSGILNIPATKSLTLSGTTYKDVTTRTINISGTLIWQDYPIRASLGATLNILAGGLLDIQTDHDYQFCCSGGTAAINVDASGRIAKSAGTGETYFYVPVSNAGVVSVPTGTVNFAGAVTSNGLFEVKPTAGSSAIYFSTSTHSLSCTFDGTTGGTIGFISGVFSVDGPIVGNADILLYGGTLTGSGTLQSNRSFAWAGGSITGAGAIDFAAGTTFAVSTTSYKDITTRTLNLSGTMTWSDYPMRGSLGATLNILPGGALIVKTDYGLNFCCSGGTPLTINVSAAVAPNPAGRIDKQVATGETLMNVVLNNHGEVAPTSGTLSFGNGGTSSGTFVATAAGSTPGIIFAGGTHEITGSLSGNANGIIGVSGGTANFNGTFSAGPTISISGGVANFNASATTATVNLSGGTLSGTGTVTATSAFSWTGGSMSGSGSLDLASGASGAISNTTYKDITARTINVSGTMTWSGYPIRGSLAPKLNVLPGGVFDVRTDYDMNFCCSGGSPMTINISAAAGSTAAGKLTKSVATGTTPLYAILNNDGLVAPQTGGLTFMSGGTSGGTFEASSSAQVTFGGGTHDITGTLGGVAEGVIGVSNGTTNFNGTFTGGPTISVSGGVANLNATISTATVNLSGGTLGGTGSVTATSAVNWTGGMLTGLGTLNIASGATMALSATTYKDIHERTINVSGTLIWQGYPIRASGGAKVNVLAGGIFDVRTDHEINQCCYGGSGLTLTISPAAAPLSAGLLTKSVATGISNFYAVLNNNGLVSPQTGTLAFHTGGTSAGAFEVNSATGSPGIIFANGTHELTGSLGGNSAGIIGVSNGTANVNGTFSSGPTIAISGGTANFNATVSTANVNLSGGTLAGTGSMTATNSFNWSGGALDGTGTLTIPAASTMTLSNTTYKDLLRRTINVSGTMIWTGYPIRASVGPVLNILAGGVLDVRTDHEVQSCCWGSPGLTINIHPAAAPNGAGTLTKSTASGSTNFYAVLNNNGLVSPVSGTLNFAAGGTSSGTFNATTGGTIAFSGGTHDLTGTLGGDASGVIAVSGATVNVNGTFNSGPTINVTYGTATFGANASTATINLSGGTLSGTGVLEATSAFNWTGGQLSGAGTLTIPSGATLLISTTTYKDILQRTINLSGTAIWQGYPIRGSMSPVLNILPGGVFDVQTDYEVQSCCWGGSGLTINTSAANGTSAAGKLTKSIATGSNYVNATLNNSGLVAPASGTLTFAAGGTHSGTFHVEGTTATPAVAFSGGTHTFTGALTGSGSGIIAFNGATAHLNGNFNAGPTVNISSGTVNANGTIAISTVNLSGGTLNANGTLNPITAFNWTTGFLGGTGTLDVPSGATMTLDTTTYKDVTLANWSNHGTIVHKGYPIRASAGATLVNHPSALFDIQTDYGIQNCCSGGSRFAITNHGTFRKSVGTGTNSLDVTLTNNGTLDVQRGRIALTSGYTQGPAPATLKTTIAGNVPDTDYGVVAITGAAVLDGIFEVALANGYTPATSTSYTPVSFTSATGDFATKNGLVFTGGSFGYARNAGNVTLTATGCTAPPATITVPATACPNQTGIVASVPDTSGATYTWTISNGTITAGDGTRSITFSAGSTSPVTLSVAISVPGCQNNSSATVTLSSPAPAITASGSTTFCAGGSVTLDAGAGYTSYLWSNGATGQTVTVGTSGNYSVTVTNAGGCSGNSSPVAVNVTAAASATTLTSSVNPSIAGQSVTFDAAVSGSGCSPSGGVGTAVIDGTMTSGEWAAAKTIEFPVNVGGSQTVAGTLYLMTDATNLYVGLKVDSPGLSSGSLTMEFPAGSCAGTDTFVYNFQAGFFDSFRDGTCNPVTDTSAGGTNDGVGANGTTATFTFYELSRPLNSGDTGHDIAAAEGASLPFTASVRYCPDACVDSTIPGSVLIVGGSASPSGSVTFFDGPTPLGSAAVSSGHATLTTSSLAAGAHSITAQYGGDAAFSGSASTALDQTVQATCPATISASGPTTFCNGGNVVLTASSGASYQWLLNGSPIGGANAQTLTVTSSGSYSVQVTTGGGCIATSPAVTVTVNSAAAPTISASGPTSFCPGGNVTLTSSPAHSYQWFDGTTPLATTQAITVTTAGSYSVSIIDANGCSASSPATTVTITPAPTPTVTASGSTSFCSGGSVTLTASAGAFYQWFDGTTPVGNATAQSFVASASGNYSVVVTQSGGCSAQSAAVAVTVKPAPAAPVAANSGPACPGGSITLSASTIAGATYSWSGPNGFTSNAQNPTLTSVTASHAGNYLVTVTVDGCTSPAASTTVVINAAPAATIAGPSAVCNGGSATLDAGAGFASYLWSTGATTQTITVAPTTTATYSVTVTNATGCSASTSKSVTVNPTAAPTITAVGPTSFCSGGSVTLSASAGASYQWYDGQNAIANATSQSLVASTSGSYSVVVTQSGGCRAQSEAIAVHVKPTPPAPAATNSGPACTGGSITLNAAAIAGATYSWTGPNGFASAAQNPTLTNVNASHGGAYVVTATVDGCPSPAAATTVVVTATPSVSITAPVAVCAGTTGHPAEVPPQEGATYAWSITNGRIVSANDAPSIRFEPSRSGELTLHVTISISGCQSVGSTTVVVTEPPEVTIFAPSSVVAGSAGNRAGTIPRPNATYGWTIVNGTITAGQGTDSIEFTASSAGAVILGVDVSVAGCASAATVDIAICSTTPPTLVAPADNAANVTSPVALQWTAVEGATGYELWLDSGSGPSLSSTVTSTTASVAVPTGATSWYVVARLSGDCAPLRSATRRFTVAAANGCAQNPLPALTSPLPGATTTQDVTFAWNAVAGAIGYRVIVRVDDGAPQDVGSTSATTLNAKVPAGAIAATVEALFGGCPPTVSAPVRFTAIAPDPCAGRAIPTITSPANQATLTSATVQFAWLTVSGAIDYRVMIRQGDADAIELARTSATTFSSIVEPGSFTWWVEALFSGCASTVSPERTFTVPAAETCPSAGATLTSPPAGTAVTGAAMTFVWSPAANAIGYELWASHAGGAPTLLGGTGPTVLTLTRNAAAGVTEWFVRTLYDRCAPVDSEKRTFTYTPPPDCDSARAAILLAPGEAETAVSPVTFRWSGVEGAIRYELFAQSGSGEPSLLFAGSSLTPAAIEIPPGRIRWFVRSHFEGCGFRESTQAALTVIAPPPPCQPLGIPTISAPAQISSGIRFAIRWSEVPGATGYVVQTAADAQFSSPLSVNIDAGTGNSVELEELNGGAQPRAVYVRVRAVDTKCNPAQLSLFSSPAVVFVLPETTSDATLLASDLQTISYQIQLGSELAGQSFTATPNQPWITVVPASGIIPAGGLTLNVTAEPGGLPPGTSIGGVTVTLAGAAAGNTQSQGTTTYTTPISVNIVSPATPTAKTSPPPDALIIPAVAHATGINSQFQSDVRVTNTSAETIKYQLSFVPSGEAGMTAGQQTTLNVEPGATVALDDILETWFSSSSQSTTGTLEIRPLTQSKISAAPSGTLANLLTFASSRTFNLTANGTFGQYIPAIPYAKFVGKGAAGGGDSILSLQQIAQSDRYRTNLGLVEGSGEPASLMVSVYGKGSAKLLEFPVQLKGGQHLQLNSVLAQQGLTVDDGRIEVKVLSSVGKVTAYASVLDNQTNDPLLVSPHTVSQSGLTSWVVPGIADLNNGAANWKTDVRLFNSGTTRVSAAVRFYSQRGGEPQSATLTLEPGETRVLDSVLTTLFNAAGDGGALHVLTQTPARLVATARTYNQTSTGTYGQFIPAVTQAEAAAVGTRPLQILQVEQSERFRTNVGLAEVSGKAVEVEISAIVPGSKVSPVLRAKLAANEFRQLNSLLAVMGLGETYNARVTVRAVDGSGRVAAYGSVIDARTQDPTYIPAQ